MHSEAGTEDGKHDPWSNSQQLNVYREALYEVWSCALICNCGKWVRVRGRDSEGTVASANLLIISHLPPLPVGLSGSPHSHSPPDCPPEGWDF